MRWELGAFIFVVFLFIGLQAVLIQSPAVWSDESLYAWYALQIIESPANLFSPMLWEFHPPLFALVASLPARVLDPLLSVRLASAVIATICILLTYWIGKNYFSKEVGFIATLLLALNSHFLFFTSHGLLESTLALSILLAFAGIVHAFKTNDHRIWFVGGIIAILSKRSSFLAIIGIAASLLLLQRQKNKLEKNAWLPNGAFLPLLILVLGSLISFLVFARERDSAISGDYLSTLFYHIIVVGSIQLFPWILFLAWQFMRAVQKKELDHVHLFAWVFLGCIAITIAYPLFDGRHLFPIYPIMFLLTATGIISFSTWLSTKWRFHGEWLLRGIVVFLCVLQLITFPQLIHQASQPTASIGFQEEGEWLKENAQGAWIYDSKERETRLYSGMELSPWGGNIHPFPATPEAFRDEILTQQKPVYAIVMDWKNPFAPQYPDDAFLEKEGFKKAKGVFATINGKPVEVIRIYRLE